MGCNFVQLYLVFLGVVQDFFIGNTVRMRQKFIPITTQFILVFGPLDRMISWFVFDLSLLLLSVMSFTASFASVNCFPNNR